MMQTNDWNYAEYIAFTGLAEVPLDIAVYCSPVLRHSAELIQAANFRSAVVF
jgi:hypothetical protein